MTKLLVSTIALALLGTTAAQARTAEVRHADLNLTSAAGQAEVSGFTSTARAGCESLASPGATSLTASPIGAW